MSEGQSHDARAAAGVVRVRALLHATLDALAPLAATTTAPAVDSSPPTAAAGHEAARAAHAACRGLGQVELWLQVVAPAPEARTSGAGREPAAPLALRADHLAGVLRTAIDAFEALSEALEEDDPVIHFDAVQATGLATAVLEAAHQRLLRAGLVQPRPATLLAP